MHSTTWMLMVHGCPGYNTDAHTIRWTLIPHGGMPQHGCSHHLDAYYNMDAYCNMDTRATTWMYAATWMLMLQHGCSLKIPCPVREPDTKGHMFCDAIYTKGPDRRLHGQEYESATSRAVGAGSRGGCHGLWGLFWRDGNVLKPLDNERHTALECTRHHGDVYF